MQCRQRVRRATDVALRAKYSLGAGRAARQELQENNAWNRHVLNVRLAPMLWDKGLGEQCTPGTKVVSSHLRNWEWNYYQHKLHPSRATLNGGPLMLLSPDETLLVSGGKSLKIWETTSGREIATASDLTNFNVMAIHPEGAGVAAANDPSRSPDTGSAVLIWDLVNQQRTALMDLPSGVLTLAYSPDGSRLAAGLRDGTVRFWNTADYSEIAADYKHPGAISQLLFLPRNGRLATGCTNGILNLWNPATGEGGTVPGCARNPRFNNKCS